MKSTSLCIFLPKNKEFMIYFLLFFSLVLGMSSCYQLHSDDDMRTVPTTNNPHLIQDPNKGMPPAVGY